MDKSADTYFIVILSILLPAFAQVWTQTIDVNGQMAAWGSYAHEKPGQSQVGLRYIPSLSLEKSFSMRNSMSTEISFHLYGSKYFSGWGKRSVDGKVKPYRMWLRFNTTQFEARAGLQKINFGSASIFRPLMWFDRIDPRDPLQLTDGVYALLGRYYFLNNSNIWFWGLYGNNDLKGWEFIPTAAGRIEYGGRIQLPIPRGEIGLSTHIRQIDLQKSLLNKKPIGNGATSEQRLALDGKWDIGIGIWFEGALIHHDLLLHNMDYQTMVTLGADYTFTIGNGVHLLQENLVLATSDRAFGSNENFSFSALSLTYPLGILDNIAAMLYYDWEKKDFYRFLSWKRTYDRWQIFLMGYWNPIQFQIYPNQLAQNAFAGKGLQLMVVFNY